MAVAKALTPPLKRTTTPLGDVSKSVPLIVIRLPGAAAVGDTELMVASARKRKARAFVLARPDKLKKRYRDDGIWAEDGVEVASDNAIPLDEYLSWAKRNRIDACFFDQNEQFDEITALRRLPELG